MMVPFDRIWKKATFRLRNGFMLDIDANFKLFLRFKSSNSQAYWELLRKPSMRIVRRGTVQHDPREDLLSRASRIAVQKALTYMHNEAVAHSYGATNLRVLSGVTDESYVDSLAP